MGHDCDSVVVVHSNINFIFCILFPKFFSPGYKTYKTFLLFFAQHQSITNHPSTHDLFAVEANLGLDMSATAQVTKAAAALLIVVADFVNFLDWLLLDVSWMQAATVLTVVASSLHVVVADLIELLTGCIVVALADALLLTSSWDLVTSFVKTWVVFAVLEAAAVTKLAFTVLLEVEAKSTWWVGNGLTLGVLILALVAIAAAASVAEGTADFVRSITHVYNVIYLDGFNYKCSQLCSAVFWCASNCSF
jgi:hypothetical protein